MAQQTINIGASPNDGTGTPLRTAFQYTNSNFSELYTAVGPSGNNIVCPGSATITGDLTVDTSTLKVDSANNRVGIGTASPSSQFHIFNSGATTDTYLEIQNGTASTYIGTRGTTFGAMDAGDSYIFNSSGNDIVLMAANASGAIKFAAGGNTESMRLNSTGLGVGTSNFAYRLNAAGFIAAVDPSFTGTGGSLIGAMLNNDNTAPGLDLRRWTGTAGTHGTTYIATDSTGATFFYNGQQASNTKATALRLTLGTGGLLALNGGNAAANGVGIAFPATQVASSDANTLDDYEEGTWTGTLKGSVSDPTTPVTATGQYTKIGNQVFVRILFGNVTTTGASGAISVTGLPFVNGSNRTIGSCLCDLIATFTGSPICWVGGTGSTLNFQASNSNAAASDLTHNAGTGRYFYASITYTV